MILRKSFYIRWSAGRSPRVHEVNPGRDPSEKAFMRVMNNFWNVCKPENDDLTSSMNLNR